MTESPQIIQSTHLQAMPQGAYVPQKPKRKESFEAIFRRFNREIQLSGLLTEVKNRRSFKKDASRQLKRLSAIRRTNRKKQLRGY